MENRFLCRSVINLMTRFGMNVVLAHPEGYDLLPETLQTASAFAKEMEVHSARPH